MNTEEYVFLSLAFLIFSVWFLMGHKYAIIRRPRWFPRKTIWIGFVVMLAAWIFSVIANRSDLVESFIPVWLSIATPILIITLPTYLLVFHETLKEWQPYRELAILGKKGGAGRWAGIKTLVSLDWTAKLYRVAKGEHLLERYSYLYLGKTNWKDDFQLRGRHVAVASESHHILCSTTGGGKSLCGLYNIISCWNAGILAFDIKGEYYENCIQHKPDSIPKYFFDPFHGIKALEDEQRQKWNPLKEIDVKHPSAKSRIQRLCEGIVIEKAEGHGSNDFFKENGQTIVGGFIAQVLTKYPDKFQNLPSVYDLFSLGYFKGEPCPQSSLLDAEGKPIQDPDGTVHTRPKTPQECLDDVLSQMVSNEELGGAPREAAMLLLGKDPKLRENFYTTVARSLRWCNDEMLRPYLMGHDFTLADMKTKGAIVSFCVPEDFILQFERLIKVFYQTALDMLDNYRTPNATDHERQTLVIFEEFNLFRYFQSAESLATFKRGSAMAKGLFVVQNLNQIKRHYPNPSDFFGNCDLQVFGLSATDNESLQMLSDALGTYEKPQEGADGEITYKTTPVLAPNEIKQMLFKSGGRQLFVPVDGLPFLLNRVPAYDNFPWVKNRKKN